MRWFEASGLATMDALVNTAHTDDQGQSTVGADPDGDFVVAWVSKNQDGSGYGVFARRFDVSPTIDVDGDGQFLPLTDGLLILRFGFGFTGNTLISGAVGGGCTRCDAPSITQYLQGLV
jgi:hypothetical protein